MSLSDALGKSRFSQSTFLLLLAGVVVIAYVGLGASLLGHRLVLSPDANPILGTPSVSIMSRRAWCETATILAAAFALCRW